MYIFIPIHYCLILLIAGFCSCGIKKNNETEPQTTVKIYDNERYTDAYEPIDLVQTTDKGFLILAERRDYQSAFPRITILKTDEYGIFQRESNLPDDFVNPVGKFIKTSAGYYFFCMNRLTLQSKLILVTEEGTSAEVTELPFSYPLAASWDEASGQLMLLSYDREEKEMVVSMLNPSGQSRSQQRFSIGFGDFDAEASIIKHFAGTGPRLPFFCGTNGEGLYFFNGYYRYALSLVLYKAGTSTPQTVIYGYTDERAINSAIAASNNFAFSKSEYGSMYFIPNWENTSGVLSGSDIKGYPIPEIKENSLITANRLQVNGYEYVVYGSSTRNGQISLYFYTGSDKRLAGNHYLGFTNPYEINALVPTSDGGIAIAGQTWIAGRFSRICLFTLSKDDLSSIIH